MIRHDDPALTLSKTSTLITSPKHSFAEPPSIYQTWHLESSICFSARRARLRWSYPSKWMTVRSACLPDFEYCIIECAAPARVAFVTTRTYRSMRSAHWRLGCLGNAPWPIFPLAAPRVASFAIQSHSVKQFSAD